MNIVTIDDIKGLYQLNLSKANEDKLNETIDRLNKEALHYCIDTRTAKAIIEAADVTELTEKHNALLNGQYFEDEFYDMYYFCGLKDFLTAFVCFKMVSSPDFNDAKPLIYNSENSSKLDGKAAAIMLYNNAASQLIDNYSKFLEFHYKVESEIFLITPVSGGYDLLLSNSTMIDKGDVVEISGTKYTISAKTDETITITTLDLIDSETLTCYPFSKFTKPIKMIV